MTSNRFLFNDIEIPKEVKTKIEEMLPLSDQSRLALTSQVFYNHGFETQLFFNTRIRKKCELVQKLLNHVIRGEQKEAHRMLKEDPGLLLEKGMAVDYAGRTIAGTALQMALGAEDVRYHHNEKCMAEMIESHLQSLPNGESIITAQIAEQFPEGWAKKKRESIKRDLLALRDVFNKLKSAQTEAQCEAAVKVFSHYLSKQKINVISEGNHFNVELLIAAFKLFDKNYVHFGNRWDSLKNITAWRKIIGLIQSYLPANYAQGFCRGYYYIVEHGKHLKRTLRFPNGQFFYPQTNDIPQLGKEFAASVSIGQAVEDAFWVGLPLNYFIDYTKKKSEILLQMKVKYIDDTKPNWCHII